MIRPSRIGVLVLTASLWAEGARAKNPEDAMPAGSDMTFLDHAGTQPFWFGAEANSILQAHPSFPAKYPTDYTDLRSMQSTGEAAISGLFTVFSAYRPFRTTELILDPEMAVGGGLRKRRE